MFDLTKNIILKPQWQRRYFYARLFVYLLFVASGILLAYHIFFYRQVTPYFDGTSQSGSIYSAYSFDTLSDANFKLSVTDPKISPQNITISVRKTYKAFTFPISENLAKLPNGSLVRNSGNLYLISDSKARHFSSPALAKTMGYDTDSFVDVTAQELGYSEIGNDITDQKNYPNDSLFLISGKYYHLQDNTLSPYISENAFLSNYSRSQVINKNVDFLQNYSISDKDLGFASATLLSFDSGVFIVVGDKVMPFSDPQAFLSFGYRWEDILPATEAEIGLYTRDKAFSAQMSHPDGTVFYANDSEKYYLIEGAYKSEIKGATILAKYLKKNLITAEEKSLQFQGACHPSKSRWSFFSNIYDCIIPIEKLAPFDGKTYQFLISGATKEKLSNEKVTFTQRINKNNVLNVLGNLRYKIWATYN